jgi:hypothetical protein
MRQAGRFLWLPWATGRVTQNCAAKDSPLAYWEGTHDGYARLGIDATHSRSIVRLPEDHFLVLDFVTSAHEHRYRLHWLIAAFQHVWSEDLKIIVLATPCGTYQVRIGFDGDVSNVASTCVGMEKNSIRGWRAPYYNDRQPATSWDLSVTARAARFWTLFGPSECRVSTISSGENGGPALQVAAADWHATIEFQAEHGGVHGAGLPICCRLAGPAAAVASLDIAR